jgi:DNA-binding MarR family transcriptional regulator
MRRRDPVRSIQTWYPQIYLACHVDHTRRGGSRLSPRESMILAHLDEDEPMNAAALARHLGIGAPALSAILKRLVTLGCIVRTTDPADARRHLLWLTAAGARAMSAGSVLDTVRVRALLRRLPAAERDRALEGLALLARAARTMSGGRQR